MRNLAQREKGIDAGLDSLLLEMMAMDSKKHARLLQFVQQRLEKRARAVGRRAAESRVDSMPDQCVFCNQYFG
jgi:hypothetical protein